MKKEISKLLFDTKVIFLKTYANYSDLQNFYLLLITERFLRSTIGNRTTFNQLDYKDQVAFIKTIDALLDRKEYSGNDFKTNKILVHWELIKDILLTGKGIVEKISDNTITWIKDQWDHYFKSTTGIREWDMETTNNFFEVLRDEMSSPFYFFSPNEFSKLFADLISLGEPVSLYDPFCRGGELITETIRRFASIKNVKGNISDLLSEKIALLNLLMLNHPQLSQIVLSRSSALSEDHTRYDIVLANPPFGIGPSEPFYADGFWRHNFTSKRMEVNYITTILDNLNDKGQAAVVVPHNFLFSAGVANLKEELIKRNLLEIVISLPANLYSNTNIKSAVILLNKNRNRDKILMIDATSAGKKTKDRIKLADTEINTIVNIAKAFRKQESYSVKDVKIKSQVINEESIKSNAFDLQFYLYEEKEKENIRTNSKELWEQCLELEKQLAEAQHKLKKLLYVNVQ